MNRKKNPISKASRDELRRLAHNLTWREIQSGALKSAYESLQRSEQQGPNMENEQRPTRGRLSKVDLLPDSIREQLHQMLREKRHTQEEIREAINALIDEHNLREEMQLSRTV